MTSRGLVLVLLSATMAAQAGSAWHTPARGTPERKQALDALRDYMKQFDPQPQVFVVRELCLGSTRGWLSVDPQSADGTNRYEPLNAVLKRKRQGWQVEELACGEAECAAGTDPQGLRARVAPRCR